MSTPSLSVVTTLQLSVTSPFENEDILSNVLSYVGPTQYRFVAMINQNFKAIYLKLFRNDKTTYLNASTVGHAKICWNEITPGNRNRQESKLCNYAAMRGSLPALQYLHSVHCPWDEYTCRCAAENGHLEILQYAHDNGCPWDTSTCEYAAKNGHLEVLQYAHNNGCPWDSSTSRQAVENGHLKILQYAHDNGCHCDRYELLLLARYNKHAHIIQWVRVVFYTRSKRK